MASASGSGGSWSARGSVEMASVVRGLVGLVPTGSTEASGSDELGQLGGDTLAVSVRL